jgi:hypothetical protein
LYFTDTDTTEYESAAETDPLDAASPVGSLTAEDLLSSFQEALDKNFPVNGKEGGVTENTAAAGPVEAVDNINCESVESGDISCEFDKTFELKTDHTLLQDSDTSLSEEYVDASITSAEERKLTSFDISGLCFHIGNLCLDSPKQPVKGNLPFDRKDTINNSNLSSDIPILSSKVDASVSEKFIEVTDVLEVSADASVSNTTFILVDSEENSHIVTQTFESNGIESPKEIPVVLEIDKTFGCAVSSVDHSLTTSAGNYTTATKTDEKIEVEFNKFIEDHTDSQQVAAERSRVEEEDTSFVFEDSKEEISKNCVVHDSENFEICESVVNSNKTEEKRIVATEGFKKSDIQEEITQAEAEDINSTLVEVETSTKASFSNILPIEETLLHTGVADPIAETRSLFENKLSPDVESTWTSASLEAYSAEKEASSEFTESVDHKKSEPEAAISPAAEVPDHADIADVTFADIGAVGLKLRVQKEQEEEIVKEVPPVLSELFEICSRQQKDLELGDEKFVDGTEFFACPSKSANLKEKVGIHSPHTSIQSEFEESVLDQPGEFTEFDQTIADEAEKILQDIINASPEFHKTGVRPVDSRHSSGTPQTSTLNGTEAMADLQGVSNSATAAVDENGFNPFVSQSSLCRSPRPSSQRHSPCESPRAKSTVNTVKDSSFHDRASGDTSPHRLSGKGSPDCRMCSNKVSKILCITGVAQFLRIANLGNI